METLQADIISTPEKKEKYDAILKQQLANRQILARIMKRFVSEFENCDLKDIEEKYILTNTISVSKTGVQKNLTNMVESIGVEDKSNNEGNITYDIMFQAGYPGKDYETIGLYINLEIQNSYHPGYPVEARGVYYAARRLSSELKKIDKDTNYGELQKVYSIWLCMGDDVSMKEAGTVSLFTLQQENLIGTINVPEENYDLLSLIVIRINDRIELHDATLRLLQTLCSGKIGKIEKLNALRKAGILTDPLEGGITEMCNLSESIYRDGEKSGGQKEKIKEKIRTICRMLADGEISITNIAKFVALDEAIVKQVQTASRGNTSCDDGNIERIYSIIFAEA